MEAEDPMRARRTVTLVSAILALTAMLAGAENWPQWRGPFLNGSTTETGLPTTWSETENVAWVTRMPGPGAATPVVWNDRVFVTSVDRKNKAVVAICIDANRGKALWVRRIAKDRRAKNNNMASPSAVTDGKTVYFTFGTGDIVAFDFDGEPLWDRNLEKDFGPLVLQYGYSSSPLLYQGKLYLLIMQNKEPTAWGRKDPRKGPLDSFLLAIHPKTGEYLWKQVRNTDATGEAPETYITPIPCEHNGRSEIVMVGGEYVTGHHAASGKELWRWEFSPHNRKIWQRTVPSAVPGDGLVYVVRPQHRPLYALKCGGKGRLTDEWLAWKFEEFTPDASTPLLYKGRLYVLEDDKKVITCLDPKTGEQKWQGKLGVRAVIRASLTGADGRIYGISERAEAFVLAAGDKFKVLHRVQMDGRPARSSISIAGGRLFIRTSRKLYCISASAKKP